MTNPARSINRNRMWTGHLSEVAFNVIGADFSQRRSIRSKNAEERAWKQLELGNTEVEIAIT